MVKEIDMEKQFTVRVSIGEAERFEYVQATDWNTAVRKAREKAVKDMRRLGFFITGIHIGVERVES